MNSGQLPFRKIPPWLIVTGILLCPASPGATTTDSLFNLARTSAHAGRYAAALESVDAILAADSTNTDALLLKGLVFMWQKRFGKSIPLFKKITAISPGYRNAWVSLATSYERNGQRAQACSTCVAANERFKSDAELTTMLQKVCRRADTTTPARQPSGRTLIEAHAGAGATLFGNSYGRSPWGTFYGGVDISRIRWGVGTTVRAERRKYGELTLKGGEVEVAPRVKLLPKLTAGLRMSFSPYALADTLFAERGITAEVNGGLPGAVEVDGAACFRWYGLLFSPTWSCGIGKYWGNYLTGGRLFIATFEKQAFYSGVFEVRRFSSRQESSYGTVAFALGRTPYESGALTKNGYLSFIEAMCRARIPVGNGYSIMPSLSVAGEQVTQLNDNNNDGINDLRRSAVRIKTAATMTIFIQRSIE